MVHRWRSTPVNSAKLWVVKAHTLVPGAAELVKSRVSVIFATGSPVPARAAKMATSTIPIVFAYGGDPVSDGLVASLSRPGGNVTGATFLGTALISKKMGLLREILPQVSDIALLVNPKGTLAEVQINEAKEAARVTAYSTVESPS